MTGRLAALAGVLRLLLGVFPELDDFAYKMDKKVVMMIK